MGTRGPQPTPTKLLALAGSWRAGVRVDEPKIEVKLPYAPKWLPNECKVDFKATARQLYNLGIITDVDAEPLARLCYMRHRFKIAVAELEGACHVEQGPKGSKATGEFKVALDLATSIDRAERSFGITPSARAGLSSIMSVKDQKAAKVDELDEYRKKQA